VLPKAHPDPIPDTVISDIRDTPFVVKVFPVVDPESVIAPIYVLMIPEEGSVTVP
jgi:hypothetical protein